MRKVFYITVFVFVVGCSANNSQKQHAVYDEVALKEFVVATTKTDNAKTLEQIDSVLEDALKDSAVFFQTIAYLEKPFGDPNSAYRNEELYSAVLAAKMKSEWTDSITKAVTRERLYLLMQNRPSSMANDFAYSTASGYKKKMHDVKADFTLLFFYNPECEACKEMKAALTSSSVINTKQNSGELKILAIYTDKDEMVWLDHLPEMPATWIHGRDEGEYLHKNKIYDLKAIPTIYLLDKDKRVLLKDCIDVKEIEKIVMSNK